MVTGDSDGRVRASNPWRRRLAVSVLAGLVAMLAYRTTRPIIDPDLWHEMALAREIVQRGSVPQTDVFAYTPTIQPVVHHEWGAGMIAFGAAQSLGGTGIALLKALLTMTLACLCWTCARQRGAGWPLLSFLAPLAILLADGGFSTIRAQLYSLVALGILLHLLDQDRAGKRWWLLAWLPIFVLWLNVHAGFLVGAGLFAVHWLEQWARRQPHWHVFLGGLIMIGLIAVNPFGFSYYPYLVRGITMSRPNVAEWEPLWFAGPVKIALFAALAAVLGYAVLRNKPARLAGWPLVVVTALAALKSQRFLSFYAVAWFCYVPGYLTGTTIDWGARRLWCRRTPVLVAFWSITALVVGSLAWSLHPWQLLVPGQPAPELGTAMYYPVGGVEYLRRQQFAGNLMTPFEWGAYVSWHLYPRVKVSMDGRYEVAFPPTLSDELYAFYMAKEGWQAVLEKYPTDAILVPRRLPLARQLPGCPAWRRCYRDRAFEIYVRKNDSLPDVDASD